MVSKLKKLECVGHVQKRSGSCIRSLFKRLGKKPLADGTSIGGTGKVSKRRID